MPLSSPLRFASAKRRLRKRRSCTRGTLIRGSIAMKRTRHTIPTIKTAFVVAVGRIGKACRLNPSSSPASPAARKMAPNQSMDWFGAIFLAAGLAGLLLGLSLQAFPILPTATTNAVLIVGIVCLVLFIAIEPRIKVPLVQLRLFRSRLFALANLSGLLNGIARGAVLFLLIFFLQ